MFEMSYGSEPRTSDMTLFSNTRNHGAILNNSCLGKNILILWHFWDQKFQSNLGYVCRFFAILIWLFRTTGVLTRWISLPMQASILSRTTTVLPFVPFTLDEKRAICSEALYNLGGDDSRSLSSEMIEKIVDTALADYCEVEGARSLYRAISNQVADII